MRRVSRSGRRRRPRYVIDTSTLCRGIRAFFSRDRQATTGDGNQSAALLDAWRCSEIPAFDWVYSEDILAEYKEVLNELKLRNLNIGRLIAVIRRKGIIVSPVLTRHVSPDPADNVFYAAAETGGRTQIVTSNLKHFPQTDKVQVLNPEQALAQL